MTKKPPEQQGLVPERSLQADDTQAEKLVRDNNGWMLSLAQRLLGDRMLAEDAVQDAFLDAFRALDTFEGRSSLKTWLHCITDKHATSQSRNNEQIISSGPCIHLICSGLF